MTDYNWAWTVTWLFFKTICSSFLSLSFVSSLLSSPLSDCDFQVTTLPLLSTILGYKGGSSALSSRAFGIRSCSVDVVVIRRRRRNMYKQYIHLYINIYTRIGAYRSDGLHEGRRGWRQEGMGWSRFVTKSIEGWRARGHTGVSKAAEKGVEGWTGRRRKRVARAEVVRQAQAHSEDSEGGCTGERRWRKTKPPRRRLLPPSGRGDGLRWSASILHLLLFLFLLLLFFRRRSPFTFRVPTLQPSLPSLPPTSSL